VSLTLSSRLVLDPHVRFRRFEEEGVLVNQKSAEALVVNEVGARLLEVADGKRTIAECAALLVDEFDTEPAVIEQDLLAFAGALVEAGVAVAEP
jgi:hypothetical protein